MCKREQVAERKVFSTEEKLKALEKSNGRCAHCGTKLLIGSRDLTMEHIIPLSKGGANSADNIIALCKVCNKKKSDLIYNPEEYYPFLKSYLRRQAQSMFEQYCKEMEWVSNKNVLYADKVRLDIKIKLMQGYKKPAKLYIDMYKANYSDLDEIYLYVKEFYKTINPNIDAYEVVSSVFDGGAIYYNRLKNGNLDIVILTFWVKCVDTDGDEAVSLCTLPIITLPKEVKSLYLKMYKVSEICNKLLYSVLQNPGMEDVRCLSSGALMYEKVFSNNSPIVLNNLVFKRDVNKPLAMSLWLVFSQECTRLLSDLAKEKGVNKNSVSQIEDFKKEESYQEILRKKQSYEVYKDFYNSKDSNRILQCIVAEGEELPGVIVLETKDDETKVEVEEKPVKTLKEGTIINMPLENITIPEGINKDTTIPKFMKVQLKSSMRPLRINQNKELKSGFYCLYNYYKSIGLKSVSCEVRMTTKGA